MNLAQTAYDHIRLLVLESKIDSTECFSEPVLARNLNISRTPVREAIRRLESEGLLEQRPKKGTFIRRLDLREIDELYQLRVLIEPFVASEAANKISADQIRELESLCGEIMRIAREFRTGPSIKTCERLWVAHRSVDIAFHETLLAAAQNHWIAKIVGNIGLLMAGMSFPETTIGQAVSLLALNYCHHSRIRHAVSRHDSRAARDLMHDHLMYGWASTKKFVTFLNQARATPDSLTPDVLPVLPPQT